jgi:Uma2 family endonuclease
MRRRFCLLVPQTARLGSYTLSTTTMERVMATERADWLSPEEYLRRERLAETKSEYVDGMLVAMSGATRRHALISTNIGGQLNRLLEDGPCEVYTQDLRVRIEESGMYAYPDVVVACDPPEFQDDEFDVLLNPTLIVEVLSESTEGYDRGLKFARYRQRPSLREYVLVAQDRVSVERFTRREERWEFVAATSLEDTIELSSIGCTLELKRIYGKVQGLAQPG